jgi:hypothetical protein
MERRSRILAGGLVAVLAACAGERLFLFDGLSDLGAAAEPPRDRIIFSHARHLKEGAGCLDCHGGVEKSQKSENTTHIPSHDQCATCHATDSRSDMNRCAICHSNPDLAAPFVSDAQGIVFSHAQHVDEAQGNCARCHYDVTRDQGGGNAPPRRPGMETCTNGCHEDAMKNLECNKCHQDLSRYSVESIHYMTHSAGFERKHANVARDHSDTCNRCHERNFCSDCHSNTSLVAIESKLPDRPTRSYIHPSPYQAIHALDARMKKNTCESCHRPTFCASCHATVGLSSLATDRSAPHPRGWLDPFSPSFHGLEARRSISACASCHDQGAKSNCVTCHQVGGSGGNPHPAGFSRREDPRQNRTCRICHVPGGG